MVQTSGIIRNLTSLAPTKRFKAAFFTQDFVTSMMMWLEGCQNVEAIVLNVARIFTRLSQSSEFVDLLREGGGDGRHTEVLLHLLFHYQQETPILVRICYILGNLTMVLTREQAAHFEKNVPDLIALLESVASFGQHQNVEEEEKEEQKEKTGNNVSDHHHQSQQALIKIIRLVANLAVDPVIGKQMVGMIELECLVALLGNIGDIVGSADNDNGEELQLNILAALANFSFYGEEHCNYIYGRRLEIGKSRKVFFESL